MDLLPEEVLDMVFQYLKTPELLAVCARVSRRWQRVVERRALAVQDGSDQRRLHRGIRAVLLINFPIDLFSTLADISCKATYLRELSAHAAVPFHDVHMSALNLMPHLTHLDVFLRPRLLNERLALFIKRLRTLVVNESIAPGVLCGLAAGSHLTALHMYGRAVHYPHREMIAVLRERAPYLRELTLRCNELPATGYEAVGDCLGLRELRLYSCWLLTSAGVGAVCRPRHVRVLHVTGARLVRTHALADMLAALQPDLRELVLSSGCFGDEHVELLVQCAPELRLLELWRCKLTEPGAQALAAGLPRLGALEVDLLLSRRGLGTLAGHPALRHVRCMRESADVEEHLVCYIDDLRVVATQAPYASKYFRPGGEGFRSTLFYFWTRDVALEPLPPHNARAPLPDRRAAAPLNVAPAPC